MLVSVQREGVQVVKVKGRIGVGLRIEVGMDMKKPQSRRDRFQRLCPRFLSKMTTS